MPYSFLERGGQSVNGFGDVLLNYRFQGLYESDSRPAFAPRFSLILPTVDESRGLGNNTLGYQFNLPFSKIVHDRWTLHANAGLTLFPDLNGRNPVNYNVGASVIYAMKPNFNLMLETIGEWKEMVGSTRNIEREFEAILSPGARYAFNLRAGQLVLGLGVPIGLTKAAPDYGAFFYLSFERQSLSWAWDKFEQAINRIHRINSPKPVNVYSVICNGTIDRRLEELLHEKGDSAELVIDGQLRAEAQSEINLADLFDVACHEFDPSTQTIEEVSLESGWHSLRLSLQSAASKFNREPACDRGND